MARIEEIERRLLNWARWRLGGTSGGLGYARVPLNGNCAKALYRESVIPTNDAEASETDQAVQALDGRLRATLEIVYLSGETMRRKAERLCCSEAAIKSRVWEAHRLLSSWFAQRAAAADANRQRVEALMRTARPG